MKITFFFLAIILISNCTKKGEETKKVSLENENLNPKKEKDNQLPKEFVFGSYCAGGMLPFDCVSMFKLTETNNQYQLFADYGKDHFLENTVLTFSNNLEDLEKINIAKEILGRLPEVLKNENTIQKTYGCPGCKDGGAIYIEISEGSRTKKFYIDIDSHASTPTEILSYARYVYFKICQLRKDDSSFFLDQYDRYRHQYE